MTALAMEETINKIEQYLKQTIPNVPFTHDTIFDHCSSCTLKSFFFPSEEYFMEYGSSIPEERPEPIVLIIMNSNWFRVLFGDNSFDYAVFTEAVDRVKELYYSE